MNNRSKSINTVGMNLVSSHNLTTVLLFNWSGGRGWIDFKLCGRIVIIYLEVVVVETCVIFTQFCFSLKARRRIIRSSSGRFSSRFEHQNGWRTQYYNIIVPKPQAALVNREESIASESWGSYGVLYVITMVCILYYTFYTIHSYITHTHTDIHHIIYQYNIGLDDTIPNIFAPQLPPQRYTYVHTGHI